MIKERKRHRRKAGSLLPMKSRWLLIMMAAVMAWLVFVQREEKGKQRGDITTTLRSTPSPPRSPAMAEPAPESFARVTIPANDDFDLDEEVDDNYLKKMIGVHCVTILQNTLTPPLQPENTECWHRLHAKAGLRSHDDDRVVSRETTKQLNAIHRLYEDHQRPSCSAAGGPKDCRAQRYLIYHQDAVESSGFGWEFLLLSTALRVAMLTNRILVEAQEAFPHDPDATTRGKHHWCKVKPFSLKCFFRHWSPCERAGSEAMGLKGLPLSQFFTSDFPMPSYTTKELLSHFVQEDALNYSAGPARVAVWSSQWNEVEGMVPPGGGGRALWHAASIRTLLTPRSWIEYDARKFLRFHGILSDDNSVRPFVVVHVRGGAKKTEVVPPPTDAFLPAATKLARCVGARDLLLQTESQDAVDIFEKWSRTGAPSARFLRYTETHRANRRSEMDAWSGGGTRSINWRRSQQAVRRRPLSAQNSTREGPWRVFFTKNARPNADIWNTEFRLPGEDVDLTREGYLISLNLAIAGYGSGLVGLLSSYWFKLLAAYMYLKNEGRPFPIVNFCSLWMSDSLFGDFEPDRRWIGEGTSLSLHSEFNDNTEWVCTDKKRATKQVRRGHRQIHADPHHHRSALTSERSHGHFDQDDYADAFDTHTGGGNKRGGRISASFYRATAEVLKRRGAVLCDDRWEAWYHQEQKGDLQPGHTS